MGRSADKSFAYILGVYLGDGCVGTDRGYYAQNTIDKDFAEAVVRAFANIADRPARMTHQEKPRKDRNCSPQWTVTCTDRTLCARFVSDTGNKQRIPWYVASWDRELRKQFVIGLMDSEGFVAANHQSRGYKWKQTNRSYYMGYKSCDPWVPELIRVMESIGLKLGKVGHEKPRKPGYKAPMRFHIKMQSWIDSGCRFNLARKQDRVDDWGSCGPYERRAAFPSKRRFCTHPGCEAPYYALGLCGLHYGRSKRRLISETNTPDTVALAPVMIESVLT